jgi:hypothetical protein
MLEGQTLLETWDESLLGFEPNAEVGGNLRRLAIAELKMEPDDKFHSLVK